MAAHVFTPDTTSKNQALINQKMSSAHVRVPSSLGVTAIIAVHILSFVGWIILQTLSFYEYGEFASWGLPDTTECTSDGLTLNEETPLGTMVIGAAFADLIVLLPLTIWATAGLINREFYGVCASIMVFGISIYRALGILWLSLTNYELVTTNTWEIFQRILLYVSAAISIWGIWFHWSSNKSTFKKVRAVQVSDI